MTTEKSPTLMAENSPTLDTNLSQGRCLSHIGTEGSPEATGYEIAWSTVEGQWANIVDAGNVTQFALNGLPDGKLYFTARAYAKNELKSDWCPHIDNVKPEPVKDLLIVLVEQISQVLDTARAIIARLPEK